MAVFKHEGINFYYEDDNNGGEPFVFLHGLGGSTEQTLSVFKQTKDVRRITIDFRGHGKTIYFGDSDKLSFNQFADDVKALLDYLGLKKVNIGGISTGAGVSLNFALRYPEYTNKLVLSRPAWLDTKQEDKIREAFATINKILNDNSINNKKDYFATTEIYQYMNNKAKYAGNTLLGQFDYLHAKLTSDKLVKIPNDSPNWDRNEWKNINIPTLILISKLDPIHPYEYGHVLKEYIKDSTLIEITPKEIFGEKHDMESYRNINDFIK